MGAAIKAAEAAEGQVVTAAMLGHKCDLAVMALHPDWSVLRGLQTALQGAGLDVVDSYVSITEVSEYAKGMPEHMLQDRLYPQLPPEGKPVFCFYPMTKRREAHANWYATPFDERDAMMREHGKSGRTFAGKVVQLITGSTGLDDFEWGVTLFAVTPRSSRTSCTRCASTRARRCTASSAASTSATSRSSTTCSTAWAAERHLDTVERADRQRSVEAVVRSTPSGRTGLASGRRPAPICSGPSGPS